MVARTALLLLFVVQVLHNIKHLSLQSVYHFILNKVVLQLSQQEVLVRCQARENAIGELIHEGYLIVLDDDDAFLECLEQLPVRVALDVAQARLPHGLLDDCFAEVDHGGRDEEREGAGQDECLRGVLCHILEIEVLVNEREKSPDENDGGNDVALNHLLADHRCK